MFIINSDIYYSQVNSLIFSLFTEFRAWNLFQLLVSKIASTLWFVNMDKLVSFVTLLLCFCRYLNNICFLPSNLEEFQSTEGISCKLLNLFNFYFNTDPFIWIECGSFDLLFWKLLKTLKRLVNVAKILTSVLSLFFFHMHYRL